MTEADLQPPFVPDGARRLVDLAVGHKRHLVGCWAVVIAAASIAHFAAQTPRGPLPIRSEAISGSIAVLDRGGPPLLTSTVPYRSDLPAERLRPIEGDDTGIDLYLPLLGHAVGERHPAALMKWLFTAAFGLLVLTLAIVAFELFGSLLFALIAPILVLWRFEGTQTMDIYWVESWCLLLCLPPLVLAARWWRAGRRRAAAILLAALALCAGFASAIRTDSGLAVVVGGGALVLLADVVAERRLPRLRPGRRAAARLGLVALLVLAYLLPSVIAPAAAAAYRDATVHAVSPLPGAPSHRPETDIALGGLLGDALRTFWLAPILLAFGLVLPRRRRDAAVAAALCALALVVGATLLRVVPDPRYALGWTGAWGVLWLLAIGWTVAELTGMRARAWATRGGPVQLGPAVAVSAVTVLVVAAVAVLPVAKTSADAFHPSGRTPYTVAPLNVARAAAWTFRGRLAPGWHPGGGATTAPDVSPAGEPGLFVKTARPRTAVALVGPWRSLPAGTYLVSAQAEVLGGGIELRATSQEGEVLASGRYWWNQRNPLGRPMLGAFRLHSRTRVRITFENWTHGREAARLVLRSLSLERRRPTGTYYAPRASRLNRRSAVHGMSERAWPFDGGTPQGVASASRWRQYSLPGAILVVTTPQTSQLQLFTVPVELPAGTYHVVLQGKVKEGGLELDLVDAARGRLLASRRFWFAQRFGRGAMVVPLTLRSGTRVRILLRNWTPETAASEWQLSQLAVRRLR